MSESTREYAEKLLARILPREARWSYFQDGAGPMFIYNTERLRLSNPDAVGHNKFESGVAVPYGPGSRSNKATKWKILDESRSFHVLRRDAKMRAFRLYTHWRETGKVNV
jgi:hypothetical protein